MTASLKAKLHHLHCQTEIIAEATAVSFVVTTFVEPQDVIHPLKQG
jgi:hypothetical protein